MPTRGKPPASLAELLDSGREALLEDWVARVSPLFTALRLTREQIVDALPSFLAELHDMLVEAEEDANGPPALRHSEISGAHGRQRLRLGADVSLVTREYALLRDCILARAERANLDVPLHQLRVLGACIDNALAQAVIPFAFDSAERHHAEAEERERFFQLSPDMFSVAGMDGYFKRVNAYFVQVLGWSEAELYQHPFMDLVHPDDQAATREEMRKLTQGIPTLRFQNRFRARDGHYRWLAWASRPVPELGLIYAAARDITDQKTVAQEREQLLEAVRDSEARFRNMADHAPVMLWVTDVQGATTYMNRGWYAFTGQTEATGLGFGWFDAIHPDDLERTQRTFTESNAARRPFRLDYRLRGTDGQYRWAVDTGSPRFDADGHFLGYIGSVIDISDRKQAEVEREALLARESAARREAEEANQLKDEFLATISHELRTPLTAILGWVQLLRTGNLPPPRQERALETIERNARAQGQLIEDLLDVSRIVSGKLKLDVEPVDLSAAVQQALESVRPAADARHIDVRATVDTSSSVMGDPHRLQQVVWNLLSNAVKFTPKGGHVRLVVCRRDSIVELTVEDTGQGISEAFLPHVFERFRQADGGTTRKTGGLGLGLAIVRHIVEMHGGTVTAASDGEGRGSTFTVRLPLSVTQRRDPAMPPSPRPPAAERIPSPPPELRGVCVLVVDDEEDARELLRTLLEDSGAHVVTAGSAMEGLQVLQAEHPDVLVSDIGMPGIDGYGFIERVRALSAAKGGHTPAVAITAYARSEDRTRVLRAGFQSHVPKPVEPGELLAVIASLADRYPALPKA
ncbi:MULTISPECIES: hybrid sensor histidine kinase/response regulator [unclassified Corallococcus]|uniref:hybrid sensor histidine kinase/response regulator n=1 Tax=unclassified Corallococcus TaxID=2685029 RepID=UPI001A8D80AA|nr:MULTISPECIES: PAS domain S-box protein [unclassified Corallococcus]MBN9681042.1 PAS domain S-box protein [Corallococcus sp. NCSPR001]WAS87364.1 PAS domain S-box protein [Corallococcus sp. NCRR]